MVSFGGFYIDVNGTRHQLTFIEDVSLNEVDEQIRILEKVKGIISLTKVSSNGMTSDLEVYIQFGLYMPMLGLYDADDEYIVYSIHDETQPSTLSEMLGEPFPSTSISDDVNKIKLIIEEYISSESEHVVPGLEKYN